MKLHGFHGNPKCISTDWSVPIKILISQQHHFLEYVSLYQIKLKTQFFSQMDRYANDLICIYMNINENIINVRKIIENLMDSA